jgi:2-polyprenyl-3-methyl-5-hydroxy-6-metoxy-1,4-benzoquinol methylase
MTDRRDASPGEPTVDAEAIDRLAFVLWSHKQGELVSLLVHLGHRLGLYRAMDGVGPIEADRLAEVTGLHRRWLLEWLRSQAAAGLLVSEDGQHFELTAEAACVLVEERDHLRYAAGAFGPPIEPQLVDELAAAFRTGLGLPYDRLGEAGLHRTEGLLGPWVRQALVPVVLPQLDGVVGRLRHGGRIADVGCGGGLALCALAEAFPAAQVDGFELSSVAADRAEARIAEAGLPNATVHRQRAEHLPAGAAYDLVLTLDCLHDMTRPAEVAQAIRRAIAPQGTWLVKEIRCADDWVGNRRNPMLAMFLGFSITACLSSSLSEPGGAGLGTIGLPPAALEQLTRDAGFTRFRLLQVDDPANLYYEVRP